MELNLPPLSDDEAWGDELPEAPEGCRTVKATEGAIYNTVVPAENGGMRFLYDPGNVGNAVGGGVPPEAVLPDIDPEVLREIQAKAAARDDGPVVVVRKKL